VQSGRLEFYFTASTYCNIDMDAPFNPRPGPGSTLFVSHADGRSKAPTLDGRRAKLMPNRRAPPRKLVDMAADLYSMPIDYDRYWAADRGETLCTEADMHQMEGAMAIMYNISRAADGNKVPKTWQQLVDNMIAQGIYKIAAAIGGAIKPGYSTWDLIHYLVATLDLFMGIDCGAPLLRNSVPGFHGYDVLEFFIWGHFIAEIPPEIIVGTTTSNHWDRSVIVQDHAGDLTIRNETGSYPLH